MVRSSPCHRRAAVATREACTQGLRGGDAVHRATALAVAADDFVAVTGDQDLLRAWRALGLATVDTAGAMDD